ncbi:hypothetical protein ABK040_011930 [Willaertia magna]
MIIRSAFRPSTEAVSQTNKSLEIRKLSGTPIKTGNLMESLHDALSPKSSLGKAPLLENNVVVLPSSLRKRRQGSAPSGRSSRSSGNSSSYYRYKSKPNTPAQVVTSPSSRSHSTSKRSTTDKIISVKFDNDDSEIRKLMVGTEANRTKLLGDTGLKEFNELIYNSEINKLLNDDDISAARVAMKNAYLIKAFERDNSKFSRKIELPQMKLRLLFETKENFYNFYKRYNSSIYENGFEDVDNRNADFLKEEFDATSKESITEDEKKEMMSALEEINEPYLKELYKFKYEAGNKE